MNNAMKLKIELKLDGNTISGRVLEQDESLRGNGTIITLIKNNTFNIASGKYPALGIGALYVRGICSECDNEPFKYGYETTKDADKIYAAIVELVNKLNGEVGGVVDEQGLALYTVSRGEAVPMVFHDCRSAKADRGKLELSLVNPELVKAVAEVRMYGTNKYGDSENWRKVEPKRYVDALYRHLLAYIGGSEVDEESGLSHLAHMACNISFLLDEEYLKAYKED